LYLTTSLFSFLLRTKIHFDPTGKIWWGVGITAENSSHFKKLFNLWHILRDVFRKHHECALQPRILWRFVKFVTILRRIPVFHHGCALKPKTLRRFVKFVVILRRIPVFRHRCDLMDIQAQNTATYSYFSSRMCPDGYSSPEHSSRMCTDGYSNPEHFDNLLNSSKSSPQRYDILSDSSRSINKKNHGTN
jgi:hypothetical protein